MLDRLARAVAAHAVEGDASDVGYRRSTLLKRGLLGGLALTASGRLVVPEPAHAAVCPQGSLDACNVGARRAFQQAVSYCDNPKNASTVAQKFECYREEHETYRDLKRFCTRRCPAPKTPHKPPKTPKKPSLSSKHPPKTAPTPPALPPNPYDGLVSECANCALAGGKCCYGGKDPQHLCVCANPSIPCEYYGCS